MKYEERDAAYISPVPIRSISQPHPQSQPSSSAKETTKEKRDNDRNEATKKAIIKNKIKIRTKRQPKSKPRIQRRKQPGRSCRRRHRRRQRSLLGVQRLRLLLPKAKPPAPMVGLGGRCVARLPGAALLFWHLFRLFLLLPFLIGACVEIIQFSLATVVVADARAPRSGDDDAWGEGHTVAEVHPAPGERGVGVLRGGDDGGVGGRVGRARALAPDEHHELLVELVAEGHDVVEVVGPDDHCAFAALFV